MNFEKPEKLEFWKNEKKKKKCWRYHYFTHVNQKPQSYKVQFLRYRVRQNLLLFWAIFCSFTLSPSPNNPENQNFEKMKKASGDAIILNLCNKYAGFDNYHKIAIRDCIHVPKFWLMWSTWANTNKHISGIIPLT